MKLPTLLITTINLLLTLTCASAQHLSAHPDPKSCLIPGGCALPSAIETPSRTAPEISALPADQTEAKSCLIPGGCAPSAIETPSRTTVPEMAPLVATTPEISALAASNPNPKSCLIPGGCALPSAIEQPSRTTVPEMTPVIEPITEAKSCFIPGGCGGTGIETVEEPNKSDLGASQPEMSAVATTLVTAFRKVSEE